MLTLTPYINHTFYRNNFGSNAATIGCAMSHISVWRMIASDPDEVWTQCRVAQLHPGSSTAANLTAASYHHLEAIYSALILEDDVRFSDGWMSEWAKIANELPLEYDSIRVGGRPDGA